MKWETQNGDILDLKDMSESHIKNCIKYIQKKIDSGVHLVGGGHDADDMWCDEEEYDKEEIAEMKREIRSFEKELKRRSEAPPVRKKE